VLVTHDPLDAVALCSSLIVMESGRITEAGTIVDLVKMPSRSQSFDASVRRCQSMESIQSFI
jgi:ABC-type sulfate/molybdate transport systems ATPase subunit